MDPYSLVIIGIIVVILALGTRKRFDLVYLLVLGNLAILFVDIISPAAKLDLAFRPGYLSTGENLYTLFTQMFVHAGFVHVLGNMLFLFLLGIPLEQRIGKKRFALVYFAAGIAGALMAAVVRWDPPWVSVLGASGAISGLVGALLVLYPRDEIPMMLGPILLPKVPVWAGAISWLVFAVLFAAIGGGNVAWEAHVGGLLAGLAIGLVIGRGVQEQRARERAPVDYSKLEPLATTAALRNALETIKTEKQPDIRRAWLEYFADHATCPNCKDGKLKYKGNKIVCPCHFEMEIR
jgi:membrane associated rhomboid family serine protease